MPLFNMVSRIGRIPLQSVVKTNTTGFAGVRLFSSTPAAQKDIVVCFDGTWNKPGSNTNIHRIYDHVSENTRGNSNTVVHYIPGIGTSWGNILRGGGVGKNIDGKIEKGMRAVINGKTSTEKNAYEDSNPKHYQANTGYEPGDNVYVLGFSRGAYQARVFAGWVDTMGYLQPGDRAWQDIDTTLAESYKSYRKISATLNTDPAKRKPVSAEEYQRLLSFRESTSYPKPEDNEVHFLGAFDTVGALGIPDYVGLRSFWGAISKIPGLSSLDPDAERFHSTELASSTRHARHALALNEKRHPFIPTLWHPSKRHLDPADKERSSKQVWFAGDHSDIGGGHKEKAIRNAGHIANIALFWMLREAIDCGLDADPEFCFKLLEEVWFEGTKPNDLSEFDLFKIGSGVVFAKGPRDAVARTDKDGESLGDVKVHSSVGHRWNVNPNGYRDATPNLWSFFNLHAGGISHKDPVEPAKYPDAFEDPTVGIEAYKGAPTNAR